MKYRKAFMALFFVIQFFVVQIHAEVRHDAVNIAEEKFSYDNTLAVSAP